MSDFSAEAGHPLPVVHHTELDSTNAEAMRLAATGESGPLWVVADRQTDGRGRSGRHWVSQTGNLHASYLTVLGASSPPAYQLSLVAGVAVTDALHRVLPEHLQVRLRLKWPNDLLIDGKKAGGILVESTTARSGAVMVAVIGIGLNLVQHPDIPDRPATSLAAFGVQLTADAVLALIENGMTHWLDVWRRNAGFEEVRRQWLASAGPIGERLTVNTGTGVAEGAFAGLDTDGALLLYDADGRLQRFSYGDVTISG